MKIIDLLNKIANREEVPEVVWYKDKPYYWVASIGDYRVKGFGECLLIKSIFGTFDCCGKHNSLYNMLYDEVEILDEIEEEKKIPEKSNIDFNTKLPVSGCSENEAFMMTCISHLGKTIDNLIDYIKSKGE